MDPLSNDLISDPEAGFLPPNITAPEGEGFVRFQVRPRNNLNTGATISAVATIYFNQNDPIFTNNYINRIDITPPSSSISFLPAQSPPDLTVFWSGSDGSGSGIAFFDIYVSEDDGSFTRWLTATTATSASFTGEVDSTYSFYSVATDNIGWQQAVPSAAQPTTFISADLISFKLYLPLITR